MKWKLAAGGLLGGVVAAILALKGAQIVSLVRFAKAAQEAGPPPVAVATATAREDWWEESLRYTGTLRPVQGVTLMAEVGGVVSRVAVENGAGVEQGQVLFELDAAQELADLQAAEARLELARLNLERARDLLEKRIVARAAFDEAVAAFDEARGQVESLRALIAKKTITAPFSGRAGIRLVNLGQTVKPGDPLIPLHAPDPIFVEFDVPQTQLDRVTVGGRVRISGDTIPGAVEGVITAINPQVDELTRTARVQGTLRNSEGHLRPGLFVLVDVVLPHKERVVAIPASAVVASPYGDSVFLVDEQEGWRVARQQFVRLGRQRGDFVTVLKGLEPGARVVSAGAFKLSNGDRVEPNDAMQPEPQLEPKLRNM